MKSKENKYPDFIFDLFKDINIEDFNYIYRGLFTTNITDSILSLAERNLEETPDPTTIKRRVYFLMFESLQNITRYQAKTEKLEQTSFFAIQKRGSFYHITSGNLIDNDKVEYVRLQLERVNSIDADDLRRYYKQILDNGKFTDGGGGGLGLIEMVRKSGNKLHFDFKQINDEVSYFYLHTILHNKKQETTESVPNEGFSLSEVIHFHNLFNEHKISLVFNTGFSQEGLMKFLYTVEKQLVNLGEQGKRLFSVIIRVIQRFIDECSIDQSFIAKPGVFIVKEQIEAYTMNIGIYIHNSKIDVFKKKLLDINEQQAHTELRTENDGLSASFMPNNNLTLNINTLNSKYSFLALQIYIDKK